MKSNKVRQACFKGPDIEQIRKREEDRHFGVWEAYLLKQKSVMKQQKKLEKEEKGKAEALAEKKQEK